MADSKPGRKQKSPAVTPASGVPLPYSPIQPPKGRPGRYRWRFEPQMVEKARTAAARGMTLDQIARLLGCSDETLRKQRRVFIEIEEAIRDGRAAGVFRIANALFDKAMAGDTTAMIFFLKAQGGWRDFHTLQHIGGDPGDPAINIRQEAQLLHVLASLSADELREMISLLKKENGQEPALLDAPKQITVAAKHLTIEKKPNKANGKTNGGSRSS